MVNPLVAMEASATGGVAGVVESPGVSTALLLVISKVLVVVPAVVSVEEKDRKTREPGEWQ